MAGKVTLYVRDEDLWARAREATGPGGLSDLIHQLLRQWLERRDVSVSPPSPLEHARRVRHEAESLVQALEGNPPRTPRGSRHKRSPA
jgi:hypothetical protein